MSKTVIRPVLSAIYNVAHSHNVAEDEVGYCFTSSVTLRHESGHEFVMEHKQWEQMGEPSKVKITVTAADA